MKVGAPPQGAGHGVEWQFSVDGRPHGGGEGKWTRKRNVPGEIGQVSAVISRIVNKRKGNPVDNKKTFRKEYIAKA